MSVESATRARPLHNIVGDPDGGGTCHWLYDRDLLNSSEARRKVPLAFMCSAGVAAIQVRRPVNHETQSGRCGD
jgi:hypothetical protein